MQKLNSTLVKSDTMVVDEVLTRFWPRFEQNLTKSNWRKTELHEVYIRTMKEMMIQFRIPLLKEGKQLNNDGTIFFRQTRCDRCKGKLNIRIMSWFTDETICGSCCDEEEVIKVALRKKGHITALEGCGYVPNINNPSMASPSS